jgi:AcrR family transcriptional regulator
MPATKDEIALTFMGLALRYGFRRTAVENVARALRISKKTIYEHFPNKEALQIVRIALADARAGFAQNAGVELVEPQEIQALVADRVYGSMVRDLLEQGIASVSSRCRTSR